MNELKLYIYAIDYLLFSNKENEVLMHATTWVNFENYYTKLILSNKDLIELKRVKLE